MTQSTDPYWEELGVAWCAITPDVAVISDRLEARIRRQSTWIKTGLLVGLPLGVTGILVGVAIVGIVWSHGVWNLVTRGIAIAAMSTVLTFALSSLLSVHSLGHACALSDMIDLVIRRTQATISLIKAGLFACTIGAVFGLLGTVIRTHLSGAPKLSPVIDLLVLALVATTLFLYGRLMRAKLEKYRLLKQALALEGDR